MGLGKNEHWGLLLLRIARWGQQSIKLSTDPVGLHILHTHVAGPGCLRILIYLNLCIECSWSLLGSNLTSTPKGSRCETRDDIYLTTTMAKELNYENRPHQLQLPSRHNSSTGDKSQFSNEETGSSDLLKVTIFKCPALLVFPYSI